MPAPDVDIPEETADTVDTISPVQRLCSEIKLFDLCELDDCSSKEGRFCNDKQMLASFEKIADVEQRVPDGFDESDFDNDDEDDLSGYDDEYDNEENDE